MAEAVDEIGTAIPLRRARGIRGEWLAVHEQQFPDPEIAPDIEWKRHVMIAHFARYGGKRFYGGKKGTDVLDPRLRGRGIGERPGKEKPRRGDSFGHPPPQIGLGPSPGARGLRDPQI